MAFGDLSANQRAYRDRVAARTRLRPDVVTAWMAAESGWGVTKPGHNYLNIGPGRTYPSVAAAADAVAQLINNSGHYAGIRATIGRSGLRQIEAIAASPWDAGRYGGDGSRLERVYRQLAGLEASDGAGPGATDSDPSAQPANWFTDQAQKALGIPEPEELLKIGLTLALVGGGLVLIIIGILTLTRTATRSASGAVLDTVIGS